MSSESRRNKETADRKGGSDMFVSAMNVEPVEILLVDDNPVDVMMTRNSLKECSVCNHLHVVEDGEEAMDFLYQRDKYSSAPLPGIIILDLNLPPKEWTGSLG